MTYNLGAVGFGHWFERLYAGMVRTNQIKLAKIAGVSSVESKTERLKSVGMNKNMYYKIDKNGPIPNEFFEGLDIVHISDPNEFHAEQTIQALEKGKITITEKTYGVNKKEFYTVIEYIKKNHLENMAYLHLHYLHKLLTVELLGLIKKFEREHGKIVDVAATFFEATREEDLRRSSWLFSMNSGGLFMDWIHPFEILYRGTKADSIELEDVSLYLMNREYTQTDPSGIEASISLTGEFYKGKVQGKIRIAKGATFDKKAVRFYLEDGAFLELSYVNSDREASTGMRGCWTLNKNGVDLESNCPLGQDTSEFFVNDILKLVTGEPVGFGIEYMEKIFQPQWRYQDMYKNKELISNAESISKFAMRAEQMDG